MNSVLNKKGFSLTEVLLAVATLTIGMTFVSGTFLTGVYLSTVSSERTIAAVVSDEAFAKIKLFGIDPTDPNLAVDHLVPFETLNPIALDEFAYPSTKMLNEKQYYWSALCRAVYSTPTNRLVQVTVFISRKAGAGTRYPGDFDRPMPVQVNVALTTGQVLTISDPDKQSYINDGYTIVDNRTGSIYRVLQRQSDIPNAVLLDREWQGSVADSVWVVPPPVNSGKNPCVAIYQKVIRF